MSSVFFTRDRRKSAVLLVFVFILAGCSTPDILVVRDQYWKAADFNEEIENRIQKSVEQNGSTIEYTDLSFPVNLENVVTSIKEKDSSIIVLSPLLSQFAKTLAEAFGERKIIAFQLGAGNGSEFQNLTRVTTSRIMAYTLAGRICRRYLFSSGNETKGVAGLFYLGGTQRDNERDAFTAGLGDGVDNRSIVKTFPRLDGISEVNDFLAGLADRNIGLFFVSMSGLNREVVSSIITKYPSFIVTERIGGTNHSVVPYSDRILASVEDAWIGVFETDIARLGGEIAIETALLPGPAAFSHEALWINGFFGNAEQE